MTESLSKSLWHKLELNGWEFVKGAKGWKYEVIDGIQGVDWFANGEEVMASLKRFNNTGPQQFDMHRVNDFG